MRPARYEDSVLERITSRAPVSEEFVRQMIVETSALWIEGNYRLKSGLHSSEFLDFAALRSVPAYTDLVADWLLSELGHDIQFDCVVVPDAAPRVLGDRICMKCGSQPAYYVRLEEDGQRYPKDFVFGFEPRCATKALLVTDIITTGNSLVAMDKLCASLDIEVVAAVAFCDRGLRPLSEIDLSCGSSNVLVVADCKLTHSLPLDERGQIEDGFRKWERYGLKACAACLSGEEVVDHKDLLDSVNSIDQEYCVA